MLDSSTYYNVISTKDFYVTRSSVLDIVDTCIDCTSNTLGLVSLSYVLLIQSPPQMQCDAQERSNVIQRRET